MKVYRCEICGGELQKNKNDIFECTCCGSLQSLNESVNDSNKKQTNKDTLEIARENVYASGVEAMKNGNYEEAIQLFLQIIGYKNADEKLEYCQKIILEQSKEEIYHSACVLFSTAKTVKDFKKAAETFEKVIAHKDASVLMAECLNKSEALDKEERYEKACLMMNEDNIHFMQQAADIFASLCEFKDSAKRYEDCLAFIVMQQEILTKKNAELRDVREKKQKMKRNIYICIIASIIVIVLCAVGIRKATHSVYSIDVEIINVSAKYDAKYYYVYMDYEIENNTGATVDYIEVTTYFSDKEGKSVGTVTSKFGSTYRDDLLNLKAHKMVVQETYLSARKTTNLDSLFVKLYNDGIDDLYITYEITYVEWSDGYTYSR